MLREITYCQATAHNFAPHVAKGNLKTLKHLHYFKCLGKMFFFKKNFVLHVIYCISAVLRKCVDVFVAG